MMPMANAMTVRPPSHGMAELAIFRNREGLARSTIAIASLSSTFLQYALARGVFSPFTRQPHLATHANLASIGLLLHFQPQRRGRGEGSHHKARQRQSAQRHERRSERYRSAHSRIGRGNAENKHRHR